LNEWRSAFFASQRFSPVLMFRQPRASGSLGVAAVAAA
jgi:hypothetical protein